MFENPFNPMPLFFRVLRRMPKLPPLLEIIGPLLQRQPGHILAAAALAAACTVVKRL
jgi:hypothetical protein